MMTTVTVVKPRAPVYTEGPPLDGGAGPGVLAGDSQSDHTPASSGEIGIIIGVVVFVTGIILAVFFWRARKNKREKAAAAAAMGRRQGAVILPSAPASVDEEHGIARFSTVDKDKDAPYEQTPRAAPTAHWKTWGKGSQRDGVEEYEITNRI